MRSAIVIPALLAIAFATPITSAAPRATVTSSSSSDVTGSASGVSISGSRSWSKTTEGEWAADSFGANVYASKKAAARALADEWGKTVSGLRQKDPQVVIIGGSDQIPESAYTAMIEVLRGHFPTSEIKYDCCLPESSSLQNSSAEPVTGYVRFLPTNPGNAIMFLAHANVEFNDKPWVDEFETFANARPAKRYITGRSHTPETDPDVAAEDAYASAALNLVPVVRPWVQRWGMGRFVRDDRRLSERVASILQDSRYSNLVSDRFSQRFKRPYGDVHRHAILVDASDSNLDVLGREIATQLRHERSWMKRTLASGAGILAVVFVLYVLVNALTKGYFTWKLRTLAAAAGVALIAILLVLA